MEGVHRGEARLECINYVTIILIPKKHIAETIGDYRPIVSKVLANRLRPMLDKEIDQYQTGVIRNSNILDGIVIA